MTKVKPNLHCKQKLKMWASCSVVHCQIGPAYKLPKNKQWRRVLKNFVFEIIWLYLWTLGNSWVTKSSINLCWHLFLVFQQSEIFSSHLQPQLEGNNYNLWIIIDMYKRKSNCLMVWKTFLSVYGILLTDSLRYQVFWISQKLVIYLIIDMLSLYYSLL